MSVAARNLFTEAPFIPRDPRTGMPKATIPTEKWVDKNGTIICIQMLTCRNPEDENGLSNAHQQQQQARFFARNSGMTPLEETTPAEIERRQTAHMKKLSGRRGLWRRMAEEQAKRDTAQAALLERQTTVFERMADVLAGMSAGKRRDP